MKRKTVLSLTMLAVAGLISAQNLSQNTNDYQSVELQQQEFGEGENPYGTFQFIVVNNKKRELFTEDILLVVEKNRLEDKENIISLSPYTNLRILSKKAINAPDFKPLKYMYVFE